MYKKTIKRGENIYTYYYTNIRKEGKVRNIFLSSDKREAVRLEQELKNNIPQPKERESGGANKILSKDTIFLFLGIFLFFGMFLYLFNGITGFAVLDNNIIELDVNKNVSLNATVFLTFNLNEYSKQISEFNPEKVNGNYHIGNLKVDINDFNVDLKEGSYTFFLSVVDNGELIAIKSQDIEVLNQNEPKVEIISNETISEETPEVNITLQDETIEENITLQEEEVVLQEEIPIEEIEKAENISFRERIVIGKPVKWVKRIKLNQTSNNLSIEIPEEATNLIINKIEDDIKTEIDINKIKIEENGNVRPIEQTNLITGGTVFNLKEVDKWSKGTTGFAVYENKEEKIKTESLNLVLQVESVIYPRLEYSIINKYIKVLVNDLENAGVAQFGTAADLRSVVYPGLRVRNLGFESNSEVPSSSVKKSELNKDNNLIIGSAVINLRKISRWLEGITGFAILEDNKNITLQIEDSVNEVEIEYETPGPYSKEEKRENGKRVTIESSVEGYTNVLSYTYLQDINPESYNSIVVYWVNENINVPYVYNETKEGLYVEWNVPHLSAQDFEVYIGQPFSSQNISRAGVYVNTESNYNYRNFTVARTNYTLYCNNLTTLIPILSYDWYKNDVSLGSNTSSLSSDNFVKGDLIYCQINGINSTDRYILDTTLGDFSNGTYNFVNLTSQSGNLTLDVVFLGEGIFGWAGNDTRDYIGNLNGAITGTPEIGAYDSVFPDHNATRFQSTDQLTYTKSFPANWTNTTVAFWFKTNVTTGQTLMFDYASNGAADQIRGSTSFGKIRYGDGGSFCISHAATSTFNNQQWHHLVITRSDTAAIMYYDGVKVDSKGYTGACGMTGSSTSFKVGGQVADDGYYQDIDEVNIWNRTLTADEIYDLYAFYERPNSNYYKSKGTFNSSVFDLGAYPNMSTISWGHDTPRQVYYPYDDLIFGWAGNSSHDYIKKNVVTATVATPGDNTSIFPDNNATTFVTGRYLTITETWENTFNSGISISMWVYPRALGTNVRLIAKTSTTGVNTDNGFSIYESNSDGTIIFVINNPGNDASLRTITSAGVLAVNQWAHISATALSNGTAVIYRNGVPVKTGAVNVTSGITTATNTQINARSDGGGGTNSLIDEVHIWNRTLSAGEVNTMYNISSGRKYPIVMQTRMGNNATDFTNWGAWGNTTDYTNTEIIPYYTNSTGENINYTYNGTNNRYIQYRALFETLNVNATPILTDVVMKEIDYKVRIFNTKPFDNVSLLYPYNATWIKDNTTLFNISYSDLDGPGDIDWNLEIYNSTILNSTYLVHSLTNLSLDNYTLNGLQQLIDGNYSWRARLNDSRNRYDSVYEDYLSDWNGTFEFYLDATPPNVTIQNITANRTSGQVIINQTTPITYGENLTLRFNLTDVGGGVNNAWIKIWQTVKNGVMIFFGYLTRVFGDLWEITTPAINATYGEGQINYTIYVNDTLNNTFEYDSDFYVEIGYPFNVSLLSPSNATISTNRTQLFSWRNATDYSGLRNYTLQIDNDFGFDSLDKSFNVDNLTTWYQVLGAEQLGSDTNYYWRVYYCDSLSYCNTSEIFNYTTDNTKPTIALNNPANNLWTSSSDISFVYTPSDSNLDWCVLYSNWTDGVWKYNSTDFSPSNIVQNTFTVSNISDGYYDWNVVCVDAAGNNNTLTTNRSIGIDRTSPSIYLNYPVNNTIIGVNHVNFSFNASDTHSIRSVNLTINGTMNSSITSAVNNINIFNYINVTNFVDQINTTWYITIYDNASNSNTSEIRLFSINTSLPVIYLVNKTPEPSYPTSNVTINATVDGLFLSDVWLEGNWTGAYENYTNSSGALYINSATKTYFYNISSGNFSSQEWVKYRWWANDSFSRKVNTSWYEFQVQNRAPTIPIWLFPGNDEHMLNDNYTIFDWENSTDYDMDNMSYELEVYNNTAFNSTYLIFAFNSSFSNYTLLANNMPPVGSYYTRVRANDSWSYGNYNYSNFSIVYATLNVIGPTYDQILRKQNTYWFNITERGNGNWINNVSIEIRGATFTDYVNLTNRSTPYDYTSYGINVTLSNVVSQYVTLYAYSWNGSIGSSTNNTDTSRFRITIPNVVSTTTPTVSYFCPDKTYITSEQMNITVRSSMESVMVDNVNASVTLPNGTVAILNEIGNNRNDYIANSYSYEYNFTYTPPVEGNYELRVEVRDLNNPENEITTNTTTNLIVTNRTSISFTSNGISNFTVKDICSNKAVRYSNSSLSFNEVPGLYNLEFTKDKITVLVSNVTLDGDEGEICVFNDLSESITPPTDIRAIDQFNLSCYNLNYGWSNQSYESVNVTYNYTAVLGSITHEDNLDIYKCDSTASCSWTQVTDTLTSDLNKIQFAVVNFSVFMLAEDVTVITVTVTTQGTGGGGGGGGGGTGSFYDLDIIEAGALTIGDEREVSTIVTIKNPGDQKLFGISLSANSPEQGLEFSFDKNYIFELLPGAQEPVTLTVKRTGEIKQGKFDVNIVANVASPGFVDSSKMVITALGEGGIKTESRRQLEFVEKLFIQNPACKELYELIKKAKASFEEEDYENSLKLSQGAINACESLLTSLGLKIQRPKGKILTENVILGIEIFVFLILFYGIYYYYRRRRFKR